MLLNLREYQRPGEGAPAGRQRERLEQALALLARPNVRTVVLAGGDTLLGSTDSSVQAVVDLQGLGLDDLAIEKDRLRIGAMVTRSALAEARTGQDLASFGGLAQLLGEGAHHWGGNVQRNRATVGGALAVAAANDPLLVALLACDAVVVLYSEDGTQQVPLLDFLPRRADWLNTPALITDVIVPAATEPGGQEAAESANGRRLASSSAMAMVGRTPMDAPILVAAALVVREADQCRWARLALGGVAATPQRLTLLEGQLAGQDLSPASIHRTAEQVGSLIQPAGDYRGSAEYRRMVAGVLSERVLQEAWERAQ